MTFTTTRSLPINHHSNDFYMKEGVRICSPLYIDIPTATRKLLFNGVRTACQTTRNAPIQPDTASGIQVIESSAAQAEVETYLGMTVDNLRNVMFARGGLNLDLVLRLQNVSGIEVITEKDIATAFTSKKKVITQWVKENEFQL